MSSIETRPYITIPYSAVHGTVQIVSPNADRENLRDAWQPGQDIVFNMSLEFDSELFTELQNSNDPTMSVVGCVICPPARRQWRGHVRLNLDQPNEKRIVEIVVPGNEIAGYLLVSLMVVGRGLTLDEHRPTHPGAKLWEMRGLSEIPLDSTVDSFPTTVTSFADTKRRLVPWQIELSEDADPIARVASCMRLYVNSDLKTYKQIVEGDNVNDMLTQIQIDIYMTSIHFALNCLAVASISELNEIADDDSRSVVALARFGLGRVGCTLGSGLEMLSRGHAELELLFREAFNLFVEGA